MRWHIQGTDATTGRDIELAVDDLDSTQAVQAAIERHIVVNHVRSGPSNKRPRWIIPLTLALVIALAAVSAGLYLQNQSLRGTVDQALAEQARIARSLTQAQQTAAHLRDSGTLVKGSGSATQVSQLADELAIARSRMSLTERELSAAHQQLTNLELAAQQVPSLESELLAVHQQFTDSQKQLQSTQTLAARLRTEIELQSRRIDTLQNAQPPSPSVAFSELQKSAAAFQSANAALQKSNTDLAAQIEQLKAELLILAARPPEPPPVAPTAETAPAPPRWAMRTSYDTAQKFLILHADGNQLTAAPAPDNLLTTTALMTSHALKCSLLTDRPRERLYTATLTLSLAADAPTAILADNKALVIEFLQTFTSSLKDPAPIFSAIMSLNNQPDSHRQLLLLEDLQITIWNDSTGTYTFQITPLN